MADYKEAEDLVNIGAYRKGSSPKIDRAIDLRDQIADFLKQDVGTAYTIDECVKSMENLLRNQ
jgi:flagellum-specific ATP synthase